MASETCDYCAGTATAEGHEKLVAWLREGAAEIEKAHAFLTASGVPLSRGEEGVPMTLTARIAYLRLMLTSS